LAALYTSGKAFGLFSIAVHLAAGDEFGQADRDGNKAVDADELARYVERKVPLLLPNSEQHPCAFLPAREKQLPLIGK
jgi:hypothetical protein